MLNINTYHWVWYLIGFIVCPRLTFMIWLTIYFFYVTKQLGHAYFNGTLP